MEMGLIFFISTGNFLPILRLKRVIRGSSFNLILAKKHCTYRVDINCISNNNLLWKKGCSYNFIHRRNCMKLANWATFQIMNFHNKLFLPGSRIKLRVFCYTFITKTVWNLPRDFLNYEIVWKAFFPYSMKL